MSVMNIHVSASLPKGECTLLDDDRSITKKIDANASNRSDSHLEGECQGLKVDESISIWDIKIGKEVEHWGRVFLCFVIKRQLHQLQIWPVAFCTNIISLHVAFMLWCS